MKKYIKDSIEPFIQENQFGFKDRRQFLKTLATTTAGAFVGPSLITSYGELSPIPQERYPDPSILIIDKRFEKYCQSNAAIERLWTGARWAEGPRHFKTPAADL